MIKVLQVFLLDVVMNVIRDDNFFPPLPASPLAGFPCPTKTMGQGWGKILAPHHGAGRGWV